MAIMRCSCKHANQDSLHGPGMRVKNPCKGGDAFRCTVCGTVSGSDGTIEKPKKK